MEEKKGKFKFSVKITEEDKKQPMFKIRSKSPTPTTCNTSKESNSSPKAILSPILKNRQTLKPLKQTLFLQPPQKEQGEFDTQEKDNSSIRLSLPQNQQEYNINMLLQNQRKSEPINSFKMINENQISGENYFELQEQKIMRIERLIKLIGYQREEDNNNFQDFNKYTTIQHYMWPSEEDVSKLNEEKVTFLNKQIWVNNDIKKLLERILEQNDYNSEVQLTYNQIFLRLLEQLLLEHKKNAQILQEIQERNRNNLYNQSELEKLKQDHQQLQKQKDKLISDQINKEINNNLKRQELQDKIEIMKSSLYVVKQQLENQQQLTRNRNILCKENQKLLDQNYTLKKQTGYLNLELQKAIDQHKKFQNDNQVEIFQFQNLKEFYKSQIALYKELSNYEKIKKIQIEDLEELLNKECIQKQNVLNQCQRIMEKHTVNLDKKVIEKEILEDVLLILEKLVQMQPAILKDIKKDDFQRQVQNMSLQKQLECYIENININNFKEQFDVRYKIDDVFPIPISKYLKQQDDDRTIKEIELHIQEHLENLIRVYEGKINLEQQDMNNAKNKSISLEKKENLVYHQRKNQLLQELIHFNQDTVYKQIRQNRKEEKISSLSPLTYPLAKSQYLPVKKVQFSPKKILTPKLKLRHYSPQHEKKSLNEDNTNKISLQNLKRTQ